MKNPTQALNPRFPGSYLPLGKIKKIHRITRLRVSSQAIIYELRLDDLEGISRIPFADRICSRPVKQCALKRAIRAEPLFLSLVFLLKRCERSRVAAERIGGGYSLAFFFWFARDFGLAHEIPDIFLPLLLAHWPRHVLSRGPQNIREHIQIHPLSDVLSRSRVFTFSTKSPRLCARLLRLPTKWCH